MQESELKQAIENAEAAADEAQEAADRAADAADEVPQTADDFLSRCDIEACLRVESDVDAYALGRIALDFDALIRKQLARNAAEAISEKMEVRHTRVEQDAFGMMRHTYRGEAFVFTRDELRELIDDALRAGRVSAAS